MPVPQHLRRAFLLSSAAIALVPLQAAGQASPAADEADGQRAFDFEIGSWKSQWSLNFSGLGSGEMSVPSVGGFKNGRGEFFGKTWEVNWVATDTRA